MEFKLNRFLMKKKIFSLILVASILIGLLPTPVSALATGLQIQPGSIDADPVTNPPAKLEDGQIWTDKSVVPVNDTGEFEITLSAAGQDYETTIPGERPRVDVVLVLDVSGSMDSNNRLSNMKTAASNAVNALLAPGLDNRVALVTYSSTASLKVDFTSNPGSTNRNGTLLNEINKLSANGGTNIQNAFLKAQQALENRSDKSRQPVIILMSDGAPTYYYTSLEDHSNRQGNGQNTTSNEVWWTIKQAAKAKSEIPDLRIYTIGFGVGSSDAAIATLMPDATNTNSYRPSGYYGFYRKVTESGQYYWYRNRSLLGWGSWYLVTPIDTYKRQVSTTYGAWIPFDGRSSQPQNQMGNPNKTGSAIDQRTNGSTQYAYFAGVRTGTEYQVNGNVKVPFSDVYKYWEDGSSITSDGAQAIINAFTQIVNQLMDSKPVKYDQGSYTDITIEDELGERFEVVGSLPEGVKKVGNKIIWTIDGDDFDTMEAGSQKLTKIHKVTFKVKISDDANEAKIYYTNAKAEAKFNVSSDNPYYKNNSQGFSKDEQGNVIVTLTNKGWLTLELIPPAQVKLTIEKIVDGPISGDHTFYFDVFGPNGSKLKENVEVVVSSETNKGSVEVPLQLTYDMFTDSKATVTVKEKGTAPKFWTYDTALKTATFDQGKANQNEKVVFENKYNPRGTLIVKKAWFGNGEMSDISFTLQKKVDGQWTDVSSHEIKEGNRAGVTISDLDLGVEYKVNEAAITDYTTTYDPGSVIFDASNLTKTITIKNTYKQPIYKITIIKEWNDTDDEAGDRPILYGVTFTVKDSSGKSVGNVIVRPDSNGEWKGTFDTTIAGTYTIEETVPQDYQAVSVTQSATVSNEVREAEVKFTNNYVEPRGTLKIVKEWAEENSDYRFRPGSINVKVYKDNDEEPIDTVTLSSSNNWQYTLTDLDFGTYRVEEISVRDYETGYSGSVTLTKDKRSGTIVITNTFSNPTGKIKVTKTWVESDVSADAVRPASITVTISNSEYGTNSAELNAANGWSYTFENLPLSGVYTVTESSEDEKFASYKQAGIKTAILSKYHREASINLINIYAKGTITITKNWVDGNNPDTERPDDATVKLYKVITDVTSGNSIDLVDTVTLTRDNPTYTFYDLELSGKVEGREVSYFVEESSTPFYTTSIDNKNVVLTRKDPNASIIVTNTYTEPKGSLTVYKVWNHGNNPDRPDTVTVKLYKNDADTGMVGTIVGNGSHTFEGLELGYEYTVKEVSVPDYSTSYSTSEPYTPVKGTDSVAPGSVTITNTYIPETGAIKVSKVWEGEGPGAEEITVLLTRYLNGTHDESFAKELTLNADNNWEATAEGLWLYGSGGVPYTYYATEQAFDNINLYSVDNGATPTLTKGQTAEIIITNTYTPDKGKLTIRKVWEGEEYPPEEIQVRLLVNGVPQEGTIVLNDENEWSVTLTELNVNDVYSVVEVDPAEEYEVTYSSESITFSAQKLEDEIVITNLRTEDMPELVIEKTAMTPSITLVGGRGTFNYQLKITNSGNRTLRNVSVVDEMDLEGVDYIYPSDWKKLSDNVFEKYVADSMAPGETLYINYTVNVNRAGTYTNTATVTGYYMGRYIEEPMTFAAFARMAVAEPEFDPELGQKVTAFDSATATANTPSNPPSEQTQGTVIVKYVDQDGDEISASYQFSGVVGTNYVTAPRDIPGYTLIGTPDNASGSFIDGTITVLYVYKADNEPEEEVPEEPVEIEEEETPGGTPEEEPFLDEEVPFGGDILPQTGLPVVTLPQLFGGALIALGLYFGRKPKKEDEE